MDPIQRRVLDLVNELIAYAAVPLTLLLVSWVMGTFNAHSSWSTPHDSRTCPTCQRAHLAQQSPVPTPIALH